MGGKRLAYLLTHQKLQNDTNGERITKVSTYENGARLHKNRTLINVKSVEKLEIT